MKNITLLFLLVFTSIIYAQDPIYVTITGECSDASENYTFNGLVNGKNNYEKTFIFDGTTTLIELGFDGVKWVLYLDGDITDDGFSNFSVPDGLLPPFTGWVNTGCLDGTMTLSQVLNVDENYLKNIIIYPNPSSDFVLVENLDDNSLFDYKIVDLTGRVIAIGKSNFNDKISVETLSIGNYLFQIKNKDGKIYNQKLIKN